MSLSPPPWGHSGTVAAWTLPSCSAHESLRCTKSHLRLPKKSGVWAGLLCPGHPIPLGQDTRVSLTQPGWGAESTSTVAEQGR